MNPIPWRLVADIGGTNARFARLVGSGADAKLSAVHSYGVAEYARFNDVLAQYLQYQQTDGDVVTGYDELPKAVCFAVACPPDQQVIRFTNSNWRIDRDEISGLLQQTPVTIINDFAAMGYAVPFLTEADWVQVGGADAVAGKPMGILGPGTGLGVSLVVPAGNTFQVVAGEGGHVDFAPVDALEVEVLGIMLARFGHVSVERLLSGMGIVNIYQSLAELRGVDAVLTAPEAVSRAALADEEADEDTLARDALALFCRTLGSVAGNLALTAGTQGGIYITGGIVPRMLDFFTQSDFRSRFEAKGRFRDYLAPIPVRVVTRQDLGLLGAARKLALFES